MTLCGICSFKFIAQDLPCGEKKNNYGVVKFPSLNSGVMSATSIEIQISDPDRVLKGMSRRKREKEGTLWYSVLQESENHHRLKTQSSITLHLTFAVLETTIFKAFTPLF